jgi:hypothetical protein
MIFSGGKSSLMKALDEAGILRLLTMAIAGVWV